MKQDHRRLSRQEHELRYAKRLANDIRKNLIGTPGLSEVFISEEANGEWIAHDIATATQLRRLCSFIAKARIMKPKLAKPKVRRR